MISVSLAAALLVATAIAAATLARAPTWVPELITQYGRGSNHSQFDAVIVEPGRAWFFGGSNVTGAGVPKVAYRSAGVWHTDAPLPSGLHSWIIAASASSPHDIWAVTYLGGFLLHWTGGPKWKPVPNGGWRTTAQLTGVTAISPTNVWLFGARGKHHPGAGTWHLSGTTWTQVTGVASDIFQGSAARPDDIWAIGGIGGRPINALLHFNGSTWRHARPTALAGFRYSRVLTLSPSNVWVAGSVSGVPTLGHFNGHAWAAVSMPSAVLVAATGICRDGRGGLWVIADAGTSPSLVWHRSATGSWTHAQVSSNRTDQVLACALVPGRHAAWGAGKAAPRPGTTGTAAAAYGTGPVP